MRRRARLVGLLVLMQGVCFTSQGTESDALEAMDYLPPASPSLVYRLDDLTRNPVRMIIGEAAFGEPGKITPLGFMQEGYGCDKYTTLKKLIKADGFNSFAYIVTFL